MRNGFVYVQGPGGPAPPVAAGAVVAYISEIRDIAPSSPKPAGAAGAVFHAKLSYNMFTAPHRGMTLAIGDVIKTSPTTVLAIHFYLGGEVGVNPGSMVQVVSERSVAGLPSEALRMLRKGRMWANMSHESTQKMLIQTNGGVMGIKG